MKEQTHEIALVGAGPVGIELAVAMKKAGLDYVHFDSGQVGQSIYWFAPQTRFFSSNERISIAGVPLQTADQGKSTREQYLAYLRSIVQMFDLQIRTYERVEEIACQEDGGFLLRTCSMRGQASWRVRKLVLAVGGTAGPKRLGIPGEEQSNVHHSFHDPHLYFRNRVLIIGGRNSAIEAAIRCYHVGADVSISYRGAAFDQHHIKYWLYPEANGLTTSGKIKGHFNTVPVRIDGTKVTLRDVHTGELTVIDTDFVLVLIGFKADMTLAKMAGVRLSRDLEVPEVAESTMQTNVPGCFIAGTAIAGTQDQFRVFIENCHVHTDRIIAELTGKHVKTNRPTEYQRPES